jgi:hypothetical protein
LRARAELLEDRRAWWDRRWDQLQQGLAKALRAQEPDELDRCDSEMRARAEEERATSDARLQALMASRRDGAREKALQISAQKQECLALNAEAQRAHVQAHYYNSLLVPHRSSVWLSARRADVHVLEAQELLLRESARLTRRNEQAELAHRNAQIERSRAADMQAREQRRREVGAEARRSAKEAAQARALRVRTSGRLG